MTYLRPGFLAKSAQSIENNRVKSLSSAKKCKKAQKKAQEIDSKGADKRDKLFARTRVRMLITGKGLSPRSKAPVSNQQGTDEWRRYI